MRAQFDASIAPLNFNGTFTFSGGLAPVLDANQQPVLDASGHVMMEQIDSIERYRRTLLGLPAALGGGASQFSINAGTPATSVNRYDAALFVGDDWRLRPNLTLNLGVRYENQTNIHDPRDLAPRIGLAWAPGSRANNPRP
jgi:outer membrane receptor protein involved in Fe transport